MPFTVNPMTEPVRPRSGFTIRNSMFASDPTGALLRDITEFMESATVTYNWDDLIPGKLDCTFRDPDVIYAIRECLVPMMTVEWDDEFGVHHYVSERLGLFFFLPPDRLFTEALQTNTVTGFDPTWALSQLTLDRAWTIYPNTDSLGSWATALLNNQTILNVRFPTTAVRPLKKTTHMPNANTLEEINGLYDRAGYWPLVGIPNSPDGLITTPGIRGLLGLQASAREINSDKLDVIGDIQVQPRREEFANQVYLSSSSNDASLTMRDGYRVTLSDPNSPWSAQNLGYIVSRAISDSSDEDFDTMRQTALSILEHTSSMETRMTVPIWPDPRFTPREVWDVMIRTQNDELVATSKWRVEGTSFGMTQESAAQTVTLSQVQDLREVV